MSRSLVIKIVAVAAILALLVWAISSMVQTTAQCECQFNKMLEDRAKDPFPFQI